MPEPDVQQPDVADPDVGEPDVPDPDAGPPDVPVVYETPTEITLRDWRPHVAVAALGQEAIDFLVDTGAPITAIDSDYFAGDPGPLDANLTLFGADWPASVVRYNLFGTPPPGAILVVAGIVGSDFLTGKALTIDYRNSQGYLLAEADGPPAVDVGTGASVPIPFQLLGGGGFQIPGDGTVTAGATRIIVDATVEGVPIKAMLDTGAVYSIISEPLLASLDAADRPKLEGVKVIQSGQLLETTLTRVATLEVGDLATAGPDVIVNPAIFAALSGETGVAIDLLLGGTFLRHFLTTVDMPAALLRLAPFTETDHINPNEWIGPGFRVNDGPKGDFIVWDVYSGTDADKAGVVPGARLAEINGESVKDYDVEEFRLLMTTFEVGTVLTFGFRATDGSIVDLDILVEDLLPAWP